MLAAAAYAWKISGITARMPVIIFALVITAICGSLFYTPDYLHLNVNWAKRLRWQIKIRWRLVFVVLVLGLLSASSTRDVIIVVLAVAWLAASNFCAKTIASVSSSSRYQGTPLAAFGEISFLYFGGADAFALIAISYATQLNLLVATALIATALHLLVVTWEKRFIIWAFVAVIIGHLAIAYECQQADSDGKVYWAFFSLVEISILSAWFLVARAQRQNTRNVAFSIRELVEFTGYSEDKIRALWATSNEQLAKNWKDAHLDESDREKMTAWYRENSELYMLAISGYNLEYKRIRDSIKMLRFGRGACLDYGAGNGEIILELARRGHPSIYFDVDGTSMRFARFRAERQKLAVEFFHSKDDLAASAKQRGLDTIFSFDVLEHLPDLPAELTFLSSLLNPGGRMAFDVPAGSTKAHPMHLNHHLDVHVYTESIGMVEERGLMEWIPFKKQEKFVFIKPA